MRSHSHIRRRGLRRARREEGQALVELALAMPLLLLLVMAIIQFGIMLSDYSTLVNASRAGARELALGGTLTDPCTQAVNAAVASASGQFTIPSGDVTASFPTAGQATAGEDYCESGSTNGAEVAGDQATVTISYPYRLSVFGMRLMNIDLTTTSTQAIEISSQTSS